jgi:hypothetical protein
MGTSSVGAMLKATIKCSYQGSANISEGFVQVIFWEKSLQISGPALLARAGARWGVIPSGLQKLIRQGGPHGKRDPFKK